MKIIFLTFTPYHIRVSNYLAEAKYKKDVKKIIFSSITGITEQRLKEFISEKSFQYNQYYNLDYYYIFKFIKNIKKNIAELNSFIDDVIRFQPDKVVFFSDEPIAYQVLFHKLHKDIIKMFVEEGTGIYINVARQSRREGLKKQIQKILLNDYSIRNFVHGQGNFENEVLLREPDLVKTESKKIKLTNEEFREIFDNHKEFNLDEGALLCLTDLYNINLRKNFLKDIFEFYNKRNIKLYIKFHPADLLIDETKQIINDYYKNYHYDIEVIEENCTSEDLILCPKIKEIISDLSSCLINACYLRDDVNVITYINLLGKKYKYNFKVSYSIYNKLINEGKIKYFSYSE